MTPKKKFLTVALMLAFVFSVLPSALMLCSAETTRDEGGMTMPETNIPDTDIGGATGGLDTSDVTLIPSVSDTVTSPVTDTAKESLTKAPVTSAAPSTSPSTTNAADSTGGGMGWIGIVITVAVIAAVVIAVLALMPKKQ